MLFYAFMLVIYSRHRIYVYVLHVVVLCSLKNIKFMILLFSLFLFISFPLKTPSLNRSWLIFYDFMERGRENCALGNVSIANSKRNCDCVEMNKNNLYFPEIFRTHISSKYISTFIDFSRAPSVPSKTIFGGGGWGIDF